jgi:hypothetical protein
MQWLRNWSLGRRKRSLWNNVGARGELLYSRVTDSLLLGGELGPLDWPALEDEGVSVVVNLQLEQQDSFAPHERIHGYLWLPAPDGRAPSLEQLSQGVAFIRASIDAGKGVFVHCKAGQGRAPLLCACYLIAEGFPPLEAMKQVQQARPTTMLSPEQSVRLREFGAHLSHASPPPAHADLASDAAHQGLHQPLEGKTGPQPELKKTRSSSKASAPPEASPPATRPA